MKYMKSNNKKKSNSKGFAEIFGTHAVYAALQNPNRKHEKLFVSQHQREILRKNIGKCTLQINRHQSSPSAAFRFGGGGYNWSVGGGTSAF